MDLFKEYCIAFAKEHYIALIIGGLGLLCLGFGLFSLISNGQQEEVTFASSEKSISASSQKSSSEKKTGKMVMVDIAGAVAKPGVYSLPSDSRVQDLVLAAGGMSANVDRQRVAQTLNLAAPLTDGAKLYVPIIGEQMVTSGGSSGNTSGTQQSTLGTTESMININTADGSDLEALPGVGEVTAGKIIDNRPYGSKEELLEKKVVGTSTFEKIKDQISVF